MDPGKQRGQDNRGCPRVKIMQTVGAEPVERLIWPLCSANL